VREVEGSTFIFKLALDIYVQ